jgi:hypothetical protein
MLARIRLVLLAMLALALAGCMTDAPAPLAVSAVPGQATITISRSSSLVYAGAPATVTLNGVKIADLGVGQSYSGAVAPGPAVLTALAWSSPGASSLRVPLEAGKVYRFVVSPRPENTTAGMLGGMSAQAAEGGGPFMIAPAN